MAFAARQVANWFIERAAQEGEYLTQLKLQKLVYMAHGWNLALLGKPLISENIEAWKWGPVIRYAIPRFRELRCNADNVQGPRSDCKISDRPAGHS